MSNETTGLGDATEPATVEATEPATPADGSRERLSVLYVAADPDDLTVTRRHLRQRDLAVETTSSVAGAVDRIEAGSFDCLLTGFELPPTDAGELLDAEAVSGAELPVVLFTEALAEARELLPRVEEFHRKRPDADPAAQAERLADLVRSAIRRRDESPGFAAGSTA